MKHVISAIYIAIFKVYNKVGEEKRYKKANVGIK